MMDYFRYLKAWQYKAIGDAIGAEHPVLLDKDGSWVSVLSIRYVPVKLMIKNEMSYLLIIFIVKYPQNLSHSIPYMCELTP